MDLARLAIDDIPGIPWASWSYQGCHLPEEVHSEDDGLWPLLDYLNTPFYGSDSASGGVKWERVEQALLAVGLALRDLDIVQFPFHQEKVSCLVRLEKPEK